MTIKIGINGMGRIGRMVIRSIVEGKNKNLKINHINNIVKIQNGMILSNEPGYYKKGKFGIRIENLVYANKTKDKLFFKNLTLAPLEKDLINYKLLNKREKNYIFKYHLEVYSKLSPFLKKNERRWLAKFI